ncbi:MAG: 2Fe-2S iron-sulfur cluster-binding protein [Acidimicrobiales bacterium]
MRVLLQLRDQLSDPAAATVTFTLNGSTATVSGGATSLLDALREDMGCRSVKDGCSPQGQCGCCTVWVDGAARVACVTPLRRVAGRRVTTVEGLTPELRGRWAGAFAAAGASQCGFCTPGILLRLAALEGGTRPPTRQAVESALLAHLCRCTGWQTIVEAACGALGLTGTADPPPRDPPQRDPLLAAWRAQLEGPTFQSSGPEVVLGAGGFADDTAPAGALVQLGAAPAPPAADLRSARSRSGKVQGRRSTVPLVHPVPLPTGEWALTLQTTWVEPAYLEPDASWCRPGALPASPLANGGAFGGKRHSPVAARARELSEECGAAVRVLWSREDVVRHGPKRPPVALALRGDGSGRLRIGRTPGSGDLSVAVARVRAVAPRLEVEEVAIAGPPVASDLRGAAWVEALAGLAALGKAGPGPRAAMGTGRALVDLPGAGRAAVSLDTRTGTVAVEVWAGEVLCPVTLRSYAVGAVHQALGLVWSEGIAVDPAGDPLDLTIRSFGILAARDMPQVDVVLHRDDGWPVNGSDAVFAATVAAAWIAEGLPPTWPTRRHRRAATDRAATAPDREEQP